MRILENKNIRKLFLIIFLVMAVFYSAIFFTACTNTKYMPLYLLLFFMVMAILIFTAMYFYFKEQDRMIEQAVLKIKAFISGDKTARIDCEEEGELYRLFYEVNLLVSTLNAHIENESKGKQFMKDTISDISHQLKTPIAALNVYNGIIQEETDNFSTIKEFATLSEQELDRIEYLVKNLLKITKLDAGTVVFEKREENISNIMHEIKEHFVFQSKIEKKKLIFSGDTTITLFCDKNWIKEAIINIIKNAFDHTETGDVISVKWKSTAQMLQIIIKDNGSGIHPEDIYHIFKRFYRSRFSSDSHGIGLGLPLAKAIVQAHDGTIEVESTLGKGAAFTINFLIPTKL